MNCLETAIPAAVNTLGSDHLITLELKNYIQKLYRGQGNFEDAIKLLKEILKA